MKSLLPFVILCCSLVSAVPFNDAQVVLDSVPSAQDIFKVTNGLKHSVVDYLQDSKKEILKGKVNMQKWMHAGKEYIKQDNLLYEHFSLPAFSTYKLRITEPELCDPSVKQYSGYLDIAEDKHLFFWFFESRVAPKYAPLLMWLNGGPGCSSSTGLLFELGPCNIINEGHNTTFNHFSWNHRANIIFLDQPVNVGFSYADGDTTVDSSPVAGKDVHAFLELFMNRFPQYSEKPFHLAAESYGGTYAPNIAKVIHDANKQLAIAPTPGLKHINLASIILANGLTDPYIQMASVPDYACNGPFPVLNPEGPECKALRAKVPVCQQLIKACYRFSSRLTCVPAELYCNAQLLGPIMETGLNPYDVRRKCDRDREADGPLCYKQMQWIETWMNKPQNKAALGVNPERTFESCNMNVNQAFTMNGDAMHNSALLLPELIEDGIRLLVYAGNADIMCNYIASGNERWVENLETQFADEFKRAKPLSVNTINTGVQIGEVRTAGGFGITAGNISFVNIWDAGHMVPHDQPLGALDLIIRWITNHPLMKELPQV